MQFQEFVYTIPSFFLTALMYADYTAYNDQEILAITEFLNLVRTSHGLGHWALPEDEHFFTAYHDVPAIAASDCLELTYMVPTRCD